MQGISTIRSKYSAILLYLVLVTDGIYLASESAKSLYSFLYVRMVRNTLRITSFTNDTDASIVAACSSVELNDFVLDNVSACD